MGMSGEDVYGILNPKVKNIELVAENIIANEYANVPYGEIKNRDNDFIDVETSRPSLANRLDYRVGLNIDNDDIIFMSMTVIPTKITNIYLRIDASFISEKKNDVAANEEHYVSGVGNTTKDDPNLRFYIDTSEWDIGDKYKVRPFAMNLTKIFGKGNEPSKEQVDSIISQLDSVFFKERKTITKEFMLMLLSEINETKNAVTTLGGNS